MKIFAPITLLILIPFMSFATPPKKKVPKNWYVAGSAPKEYVMTTDYETFKSGVASATIVSKKSSIKGFGTLMQSCDAKEYVGTRIKLSGYMKSDNVDDWAGFWLRIDGEPKKPSLAFDNMQDRAIIGTTDWQYYEIILDVPEGSTSLNYGALMSGTGQIWFDNLSIQIVEKTIPITGEMLNQHPVNLDFEE